MSAVQKVSLGKTGPSGLIGLQGEASEWVAARNRLAQGRECVQGIILRDAVETLRREISPDRRTGISSEECLAEVVIRCLALADVMEFDLGSVIDRVLQKPAGV